MQNVSNLAAYYFHQGTNYNAYEYLGCNLRREDDVYIYSFRTWAPNAISVEIISDFFGWDNPIPMQKITEKGIWEYIFTSDFSIEGCSYKYLITSQKGKCCKSDPYARFSKGGSDGASIVLTESNYSWHDDKWISYRKEVFSEKETFSYPLSIYEVHLGSFIRQEDGGYLNYKEIADIIVPYVKGMGFTHIEIMPIAEYPFDGSWGYQVGAFYAPTSRFGTPDDFRYFIDQCHISGVGVIVDWVCAHFPKDEWGLYEFDGKALYEYQGADRQESQGWGTRFFDLGREEIQSFLISCALYYLREFHIDALRVDAVASMLYLDYDKSPGKWVKNSEGGKENLEAIAFFKKLNTAIKNEFSDILIIAEESGSYGGITKDVTQDGLGFDLKWNMGWANDFFDYLSTDPIYRKYKHGALTFPIMYAFNEKYLLPISHDEVVHGKLSFINKNFGSYEDKFRSMRSALLLMMTYPGKKLIFMGTEYGQFREWDYQSELEWFMLDYQKHSEMREYLRSLNLLYNRYDAFWTYDFSQEGFLWIYPNESDKNVVVYKRFGRNTTILTVINFSGSIQEIKIPIDENSEYECIFSTDNGEYGLLNYGEANIGLPALSGRIYLRKEITTKITL